MKDIVITVVKRIVEIMVSIIRFSMVKFDMENFGENGKFWKLVSPAIYGKIWHIWQKLVLAYHCQKWQFLAIWLLLPDFTMVNTGK